MLVDVDNMHLVKLYRLSVQGIKCSQGVYNGKQFLNNEYFFMSLCLSFFSGHVCSRESQKRGLLLEMCIVGRSYFINCIL